MPTELLVVLFIGFLNVCLGYAFAVYIWPGAPPVQNQRPLHGSMAQGSMAQGSTAQGSTAQGSTAQGSTAQGSTAQGSTANVSRKTVRIARPSRFRTGSRGVASIDTRNAPAATDSDSGKQLRGSGAPAFCRAAEFRVVNKIDHLHKRLKRIGQQVKQLGEAPDGRAARTLRERIDRVSRGGIEDLRYAVREASSPADEETGAEIDTLAFRVCTIVDGLGSLDFDNISPEDSVVQLRQASDNLAKAISMSKSNLQRAS